jgi:glutathione S-transferase
MLNYTALMTVLSVLLYAYSGILVAQARKKFGVEAPAITGNPDFERVFRVQMNTLEWMPIYLPLLWLFAFYVGDMWAALIAVVWCIGRGLYYQGYSAAANKRGPGFGIQALSCAVLLVGDVIAIVARMIHGG